LTAVVSSAGVTAGSPVADIAEAVSAFIEKRDPRYQGR
jgi:hypothetical protein